MGFFRDIIPFLFSALILGLFARDISAQGTLRYDHTRRSYGQSLKHFMESRKLHREIIPPYNQGDTCEENDTCCEKGREIRYLVGLQFLLQDTNGGEKFHILQDRYDALRGRAIIKAGLETLGRAYRDSLEQSSTTNTEPMVEMILVDRTLEMMIDDERFHGALLESHKEGLDLAEKFKEHLDCEGENICMLLERSKENYNDLLWGFISAYRAQGEGGGQQSFDVYKKILNGGLPVNLTDSSAKLDLLKRVQENSSGVSVSLTGPLNSIPDIEEGEGLTEIRRNIEGIRSSMFYQLLATFKNEELASLKEDCNIEDKPSACFVREEEEGEEDRWAGKPISKAIFDGFLSPYNKALASKDGPAIDKMLSDTSPEFFSLDSTPNCVKPFCFRENPYFNPSLNALNRKSLCPGEGGVDVVSAERSVASAEVQPSADTSWLDIEEARIRDALVCTLNHKYPPPPPAAKRIRTLNFMTRRLTEQFATYGIESDREKAHFLSQVIHETGGLAGMAERGRGGNWQSVNRGRELEWNCDAYLGAMEGDKNYLDNEYRYSKNSYKGAFRGRGLIQLTGCRNYVRFFYHKAALKAGREDLANETVNIFYQDDWGDKSRIGWYCDENIMSQVAERFKRDGLTLEPQTLVNDCENTLNQLALPCKDRSIGGMSSQEFIIDSSLWFWKKNVQQAYRQHMNEPLYRAVAKISAPIHGKARIYNRFTADSCNLDGSIKDRSMYDSLGGNKWIMESFCGRLKSFKAVDDCLGGNQ